MRYFNFNLTLGKRLIYYTVQRKAVFQKVLGKHKKCKKNLFYGLQDFITLWFYFTFESSN